MKRTRLLVAALTLTTLAAAGTAAAADTAPAPGAVKSGDATIKSGARAGADADADLAAIAAKLGVTTERLDSALVAAKMEDVPPGSFVTAVAADLGLPVSQVRDALGPIVAKPAPDGDNQGRADSTGTKARDGSQDSPFTTDAAAASLAAALGVDQAKAKDALAALVALGRVRPTSTDFGDIAASLGVGSDRLDAALRELKRSLSQG
ncbi:hypothetical protein GCM10027161_08910 [Microbispora hainanensis]